MKQNKITTISLLVALLFPIVISSLAAFAANDDTLPNVEDKAAEITESLLSGAPDSLTSSGINESATTSEEDNDAPLKETTSKQESATLPETESTTAPETTTPEVTTTPEATTPPEATTTPEITTTTPKATTSTTTQRQPGPQNDPIKDGEVSQTPPVLSPSFPVTEQGTTAFNGSSTVSSSNTTLAAPLEDGTSQLTQIQDNNNIISGGFVAACLAVFGSMTIISLLFFIAAKKG